MCSFTGSRPGCRCGAGLHLPPVPQHQLDAGLVDRALQLEGAKGATDQ
jgi:hypothetical protein